MDFGLPRSTPPRIEYDDLLQAARRGDGGALEHLIAPYRGDSRRACYRMLGSVHDAEDALPDALLRASRAWRASRAAARCATGLPVAADAPEADRAPARSVLPIDHGPPARSARPIGTPLIKSTWIKPCPDERLGAGGSRMLARARYELRESVELAFTGRSSACRRSSAPC